MTVSRSRFAVVAVSGCLLASLTVRAAEAPDLFVLPEFPAPLTGRTRDGAYVEDLEVFRLPVASLAQEQEAFTVARAGLEVALDEADPGAAIDYLAGYLAVLRSAEWLVEGKPGTALPPRDRFRSFLEQRAEEAWREGRPGTALLAWVLWDRASRLPSDRVEQVERTADANGAWVVWRRRVLAELPRILPPVAGIGTQGPTIPAWSPLLRHARAVLDERSVPHPVAAEIRNHGAPPRDGFLPAAEPGAVLRLKVTAPREIPAPGHSEALHQVSAPITSDAFLVFERTQREKLAELDRRIAAAQARADREAPKITVTERTRTLVGYEDRPIFERALPFGAKPPGVRQGDVYRSGTIRVPIYEERTISREAVDPAHPLNRAVQALGQERLSVVQKEFPRELRDSFIIDARRLDHWAGTADVPLEIVAGGDATRLVLRVPIILTEERDRGRKEPDLVSGERAWRVRAQDPADEGAADLHRAVALWWNFRRLEPRLGAELAAREVALLGELGFGLRPDGGPVVSRLRDMFQFAFYSWTTDYREEWRTGSAPPARTDPGAPVMASEWPGFAEKAALRPPPAGEFRLVHDPAVEREAVAVAERLRTSGLALRTEQRALPRTAQLFPVLAFARSRSADLGGFLSQSVPEQMPALHDDASSDRELRLHAPADGGRFAEGMAWILAHPSRFTEARRLARRLRALGGPQTYVEISVSVRGVVREGHPERTVLAPDPGNRWLRSFLQSADLADYLPTQTLRLGPRRWPPPDLVVVLRGHPDSPARGLPAGVLNSIEGKPEKLLLVSSGSGQIIDAATTTASSLPLW